MDGSEAGTHRDDRLSFFFSHHISSPTTRPTRRREKDVRKDNKMGMQKRVWTRFFFFLPGARSLPEEGVRFTTAVVIR